MDFNKLLAEKIDTILDKWIVAVYTDEQIESSDDLSYQAIRNHIPDVLRAIVTVISENESNDFKSIVIASWKHGELRSEQGFNPEEIAREYHHLRTAIFSTLEPDLLKGKPSEIIRSMRLIDAVIDEAITRCFHSFVQERLKELYQLQSSLTLHNQELTRLVNTNQDYFSQIAHDLKQPLTSIIGYSDLFLREQRKKIDVKESYSNLEHIERVLRNGRHLLRLINNLLEIARYNAGKIKLKPAPTNICELINSVSEVLEPSSTVKNLPIVLECDLALSEVITDEFQLQQIIINLLSNAIRYTERGKINIRCQVWDHEKWAIAISDTGIGIKPEDQAQIFEPFFRSGSSNNSYLPDSTGLGLAIVFRLVKLLQGEINLVSQVGVGSTFTVTFPWKLQINH